MILYCADHVILFAGWANGGHTAFYGYQESGCSTPVKVASYGLIGYPMSWGDFHPYRLHGMSSVYDGLAAINLTDMKPTYEGLFDFSSMKADWLKREAMRNVTNKMAN